ncbi:MAG: Hsp33 family molecular chaperone HslO [Clostridia bacterium]|nr:Hsp33 family molecular chaperone HslO [Clostridia bacterium]
MNDVFRALVYGGEVSLTVADTTELVKEGVQLHNLTHSAAQLFGRALSLAVFQGACLKEKSGEISFSLRGDGLGGELCVSVDEPLHVRGYLQDGEKNARFSQADLLGREGALTVIRQDGYSRPFVGSSALVEGDIDKQFEEYYRVSEQLPTYLATDVRLSEDGQVVFAGMICLQPLPFATQNVLKEMPVGEKLYALLEEMRGEGVLTVMQKTFGELQTQTRKQAQYRCRCSKEYLGEVLVSLGEAQMREIIREDGAVRIHCHYCNKDYEFLDEDVDVLFPDGSKES